MEHKNHFNSVTRGQMFFQQTDAAKIKHKYSLQEIILS
jgi:hypothetical protein